jgi:DNA-binding GntR family transcriptional regulator
MPADDDTARTPAHEAVYRALRARLLDGALPPGRALTLRGVAEELGVSMTPAREAVRRLVAERALEATASGRVLVPEPGPAALDELFRARSLLEPELALRALPRADRTLIQHLRALDDEVGHHLDAGDAEGYVRANTAFHTALYIRAGAPALMALVESVWLQTSPAMRRVYGRIGTGALVDYHKAALDALATRDPGALAAAIRSDVEQGATLMREALLDRTDL